MILTILIVFHKLEHCPVPVFSRFAFVHHLKAAKNNATLTFHTPQSYVRVQVNIFLVDVCQPPPSFLSTKWIT